ncbi:MAG TPA: hypothetical protein VGM90_31205 [Kofleriaceae bacterium]|jgi:hypothetical protein
MSSIDGAGERESRLVALLKGARAWLDGTDDERLFDAMLGEHPGARALIAEGDRLDHIGFLLPPWAKEMVGQAATAAGFPLGQRAFPSALVARDLGRVVGRRRVETQIFKAHGRGRDESLVAFEAFLPNAADADVEDWIRRGVVQHVALEIADPTRFITIHDTFAVAGIPMAQFMYGNAVYLPGEDATIAYFDLDAAEHPFRLEVRVKGEHVRSAD